MDALPNLTSKKIKFPFLLISKKSTLLNKLASFLPPYFNRIDLPKRLNSLGLTSQISKFIGSILL